jgi:AcrR family transcriptional regulator
MPQKPRPATDSGGETAAPQRILRAAETFFVTKGYTATTIRDIAAAAKVSNATIVKYFGGKPELFFALVGEVTAQLIGATAMDFAGPPAQGLINWGSAVLRLLLEPRLVMAARHLYGDISLTPALAQRYDEIGPRKLAVSLSLQLQNWANQGLFPAQDSLTAAIWFMHLLGGGLYQRVLLGLQPAAGDAEIEQAAQEATRIFLAAFGPSR